MKTKLTKLVAKYKTEVRELRKNKAECTREVNPVVYGCVSQLEKVILDLEYMLKSL